MTVSTQAIINQYSYDPFGNVMNKVETVPQPFTFVGQYGVMTEPNGFYYMRARYYDPEAGRFISEDPMGFDGGDVNLYVYCGNNPILLIDPWGLCSGGFRDAVGTIGSGIVQAVSESSEGWIMAGKVVVLTKAFVAVKTYALYDMATGGPVTTTVMASAGTPQGQQVLKKAMEFVESANPGMLPPKFTRAGIAGWYVGGKIEEYSNTGKVTFP